MADTYRASKAVVAEAAAEETELGVLVRDGSPLTLPQVVEMRESWAGGEGRAWAAGIVDAAMARALEMVEPEMEPAVETEPELEVEPDLRARLTSLLADTVSLYLESHGAHWNVTGPDFAEYHRLFGDIYADVYESIDPLAENLRKLGAPAPYRLPELCMLRSFNDGPATSDARVLAASLLAANDEFLSDLDEVFESASEENQQGIANFIAERIDAHQTWRWQLSATLGVEPSADLPDLDDTAEDRAAAARIGVGTFVSWPTANGRANGKVENVVTKGPAESSDGYVLEATADAPVFVVRIYKQQGNGWIPTDQVSVHRNDYLSITGTLPAPRSAQENDMIEERKSAIAIAERFTMEAEVRAVQTDDGKPRIAGYAATFNREASGLPFREVIAPGAFTRCLQSAEPVFLLINHDTDALPLASTASGTLQLREDKVGLRMEAELDPANPRALELISALSRGDVTKMSFAFTVAPGGETREEGLRTLTDLNLFEVSVVTWPAYDSTDVGMRDAQDVDLELRRRQLTLRLAQLRLNK